MITNKTIYHLCYDLVKYAGYELIAHEEDEWILTNEKKKRVIRLISRKMNVQAVQFLMDKTTDHFGALKRAIGFVPEQMDIYLLNQDHNIKQIEGNISVQTLNDKAQLKNLDDSLPFRWFALRRSNQSENFYKSKFATHSFIDKAMIKFAPATTILIVLNVIIYIINLIFRNNELIDRGGLTHFNFVHGDYYRIISAIFLHFDFSHILFNMMALFLFGKIIEYLFGSIKFLIIYFGSGIFGNILSLAFDTTSMSVGASGAISGLLGALIAYFAFSRQFNRKFVLQTALGMVIYLLISNVFAEVNNYAHFGGLLGGFMIAAIFYLMKYDKIYLYIMAGGLLLMTGMLLYMIFSQPENHIYNVKAHNAMASGDFKSATSVLKEIFDNGYENDETYVLYGQLRAEEDSLQEAIAVWQKGLKAFPASSKLNYQMALAMRAQDNYKEARSYLKQAEARGESNLFTILDKELEVFK